MFSETVVIVGLKVCDV